MDSDYGDDFEASYPEGPTHHQTTFTHNQVKKGSDNMNYPSSCRTVPEEFASGTQGKYDYDEPKNKRIQSMQNVKDNSDYSDYDDEFEDDDEQENRDYNKNSSPAKGRAALDNLSSKKQADTKGKTPLISLDQNKKAQDAQRELELENNNLKAQLKVLKEQLNSKGQQIKSVKQSGKKADPKAQSYEEKIRNINRELSNIDKVLALTEEEHRRMKIRFDRIKNAQYTFDLEKELEETFKSIEEIKKENKKLTLAAKASGRALEKKEMIADSADLAKEIDIKAKEGINLATKLEKIQEKNANFEEDYAAKMEKLSRIQADYDKLAESKKDCNDEEEDSEKIAKYNHLKKKAEIEGLKLKDAKKKFYLKTQLEKEIEDISERNLQTKEQLMALSETLNNQQAEIRTLARKAGVSGYEGNENVNNSQRKAGKELSAKSSTLTSIEPASVTEFENNPSSAKNIKPPLYNKKGKQAPSEFCPSENLPKIEGTSKQRIIIGKLKERRKESISSVGRSVASLEGDENKDVSRTKDMSSREIEENKPENLSIDTKKEKLKTADSRENVANIENRHIDQEPEESKEKEAKAKGLSSHRDGQNKAEVSAPENIEDNDKNVNIQALEQETLNLSQNENNKKSNTTEPLKREEKSEELVLSFPGQSDRRNRRTSNMESEPKEALTLPTQKAEAQPLSLDFQPKISLPNEETSLKMPPNKEATDQTEIKLEQKNESGLTGMNRLNRARRGTPTISQTNQENKDKNEFLVFENPAKTEKRESFSMRSRENKEVEGLEEIPLQETLKMPLIQDKGDSQREEQPKKQGRDRTHLFGAEPKPFGLGNEAMTGPRQEDKPQFSLKETNLNMQGGFGQGKDANVKKQSVWEADSAFKNIGATNNENQENLKLENKGEEKKSRLGMRLKEDSKNKEKNLALKAQMGNNGFFDELDV